MAEFLGIVCTTWSAPGNPTPRFKVLPRPGSIDGTPSQTEIVTAEALKNYLEDLGIDPANVVDTLAQLAKAGEADIRLR